MEDTTNQKYIEIGGAMFRIRKPARDGSLHKYMEEVRKWRSKAYRMVFLMSRSELQPMVLK